MVHSYSTTTLHESVEDWAGAQVVGLQAQDGGWIVPSNRDSGQITSPVLKRPAFNEVTPSWNVRTWSKGKAKIELRVKQGTHWSRWYSFGVWSKSGQRYSVKGQKDQMGEVFTDTLRLKNKATQLQYRLTLYGSGVKLKLLALNTTDRSKYMAHLGQSSNRHVWGRVLDVPSRSQMVYPKGNEWCSPTSVSMLLARYGVNVSVPVAAAGMFDHVYNGTGNWPFNTAYAGEHGLRAFVTRLDSLATAEKFISAGIPLAISLSWKKGELSHKLFPVSPGHLLVLVGFDRAGNPVVNDPAARNNQTVRQTYQRAIFEKLWLRHSGGLSYVIMPYQKKLPKL